MLFLLYSDKICPLPMVNHHGYLSDLLTLSWFCLAVL